MLSELLNKIIIFYYYNLQNCNHFVNIKFQAAMETEEDKGPSDPTPADPQVEDQPSAMDQ